MHVAILTGGDNAEREVALRSADTVRKALEGRVELSIFDFPSQVDDFLAARASIDCCVPVFHGKGGEDGVVQGFLETLKMPYVFSCVKAHAVAIDKVLTKKVVSDIGHKTADWTVLSEGDVYTFSHPIVLKPIDSGSSHGVHLVRSASEFDVAIKEALEQSSRVIAEDLIEGREFTVTVLDDGIALPVIEIKSKNTFFDFESKYDSKLFEEICPAHIEDELSARLQTLAVDTHRHIGARHLSRTDIMVSNTNEIYFLEINTIPGLTDVSLVHKSFHAAGHKLGDLLVRWINESI